ncbi:hypothetical protein Pelo_402 [Pelomyxa schiedti]|nr:hypothetical protein Pelo_402 [Pelomyxa schiedti]
MFSGTNNTGRPSIPASPSTLGCGGGAAWIRAKDQLLALLLGAHPRCGSRLAPLAADALAHGGSLVPRLLWSFVTETATNFVLGEAFRPPNSRPHAFSVSPVLLALTRDPGGHERGSMGAAGVVRTWWVSPTRWVDMVDWHYRGCGGFKWLAHDCASGCSEEGRGGRRGATASKKTEVVLWKARNSPGACDVNWKWFVAGVVECEEPEGDDESLVRERCGGMVGVVIMSLVEVEPRNSRVVVPISGEFNVDENEVDVLSFSRNDSSETLAVVTKNYGSTAARFILFDVESSHKSKSLVIVSETRAVFPPGYVVAEALSMKRIGGCHCFIVHGKPDVTERRRNLPEIVEVNEAGVTTLLIEGCSRPRSLYRVSDSRFCVRFDCGDSLCKMWDCSGGTTALVMCVPGVQANFGVCVAAAESGFIFTADGHQLKGLDGVWALPSKA